MKKLVLSLATLVMILAASPSLAQSGSINWHTYDEGLALAKAQNKPAMLVFSADWCVFCHKLQTETFTNAEIAHTINSNFVAIIVDYDQNPDLVSQYEVGSIPDIIILKAEDEDFTVVQRHVGHLKVANMQKYLNESIAIVKAQ